MRDVKSLGMVLDALVKAGSNTINGISFSIAEPTPLEDRARALAVADARRRAALYARAGGVKLGNIISISEQPITVPVQREDFFSDALAKGGRSAGVSIASGELDVMATVFVLYEIRR